METLILYCIFNRPDVVEQTFVPIKEAKPKKLYIASDGARENREDEDKIVEQTRKYVLDNIDWNCEVHTLFQDKNLGCDTAVPKAIEWFFKYEEMGIILEDDILASQEFFEFCTILLEKYKNDQRVRSIGGFCISKGVDYEYDYAFTPRPLTWGWAAWRRSWDGFDITISDWKKLKHTQWLKRIFNTHIYKRLEWSEIFDIYFGDCAWDYAYSFANMKLVEKGCYSLSPANKNLITNIGYSGVHFNSDNCKCLGWKIDYIDVKNLKHPKFVGADEKYLKMCYDLEALYEAQKYKDMSFLKLFKDNFIFLFRMPLTFLKYLLARDEDTRNRRKKRILWLKYNFKKTNFYYWINRKNRTL